MQLIQAQSQTATSSRQNPAKSALALRLAQPNLLIVALLILGVGVRCYHLGARSLWIDEVITAEYQPVDTLAAVISKSNAFWDTMPLPAVLTWLLRGFGSGEVVL